VILTKFDHIQRTIIVEKWEEVPRMPPRAGAASTRLNNTLETALQQTITITQNHTNPISYNVVEGH
jgi:hypothetical protein